MVTGGISLFFKTHLSEGISLVEVDDSGFIWVKFCKDFIGTEDDVYICFSYIPPSNSVYYAAHKIGYFESLERDIRNFQSKGKIFVIGDLNARCGERSDILENPHIFDKYIHVIDHDSTSCSKSDVPQRFTMDKTVNTSGLKLLDLCISSDLKIVNGRVGDDAGVGSLTYFSTNGCSLIDYVLASPDIFQIINDFIAHDLTPFSPHVPIELQITVKMNKSNENNESDNIIKILKWDKSKTAYYIESVKANLNDFENIIDNIISGNTDIDICVDNFSKMLHDKAFDIFGQTKTIKKQTKCKRKHKSPWFTNRCETARRDLRQANKHYTKYRTLDNRYTMIEKRRIYRNTKRRTRAMFYEQQRKTLHNLAQTNPQKFWAEIRKVKNKANDKNPKNQLKSQMNNTLITSKNYLMARMNSKM